RADGPRERDRYGPRHGGFRALRISTVAHIRYWRCPSHRSGQRQRCPGLHRHRIPRGRRANLDWCDVECQSPHRRWLEARVVLADADLRLNYSTRPDKRIAKWLCRRHLLNQFTSQSRKLSATRGLLGLASGGAPQHVSPIEGCSAQLQCWPRSRVVMMVSRLSWTVRFISTTRV